MHIRTYVPADLPTLQQLTIAAFDGIAMDQEIEKRFGPLGEHDWRWRKARHIEQDCAANPGGVFVAEEDGRIIGYITTVLDRGADKGRIPNFAVDASMRGRGIGRLLIQHALEYFRREGLAFAMIETMTHNPIGQHLYPSCGFEEIGRQIHYALKL
jgi:ribosomal protein S18 acetylase RimI-like enzyme